MAKRKRERVVEVPEVEAAEAVSEPVVVAVPKEPWVGNGCPVEPCMKERNHVGEHTQGGIE